MLILKSDSNGKLISINGQHQSL